MIALKDRLNVIKLRISKHHVDDIDYFTFPKRFLQNEIEKATYNKNLISELPNIKHSKKIMIQEI